MHLYELSGKIVKCSNRCDIIQIDVTKFTMNIQIHQSFRSS
jgi:CheY-specific phosphatase CheX